MSTGSSAQVRRRGVFPRLRDARIRSKLALILLVPLAAVVFLAATRLVDVAQNAGNADQVEKLTELDTDVSALTQSLHVERMAAAEYLANQTDGPSAYNATVQATDAQIQTYRTHRRDLDDPPATVADRLARIDDHLNTMDATRTKVGKKDGIAVPEAISRYGVVITDLVGYSDAVSQFAGDGEVADGLRAISAFAKAKAGTAEQEAISYAARASGDLSPEQRAAFIATQTTQQEALQSFALVASPSQRSLVDNVVTGDAINLADQVSTQLGRGELVSLDDVTHSFGAVVDLMRWAEQQLENRILDQATNDRADVIRQGAIEAALVVLVLLIAVALAVILARSLNLSLRRLREGALAVANRDLPDAVARLRDARNLGDGGVDNIVNELRDPIQLDNRDEIGQVAQAFNVVHREAVRVAAEQAALRTSVSSMFLNLARRSQSLVDRMIGELDTIERTEEDPKRLARLFELDHLATRMRRNDENLLVLAGADSSAPRREDALLVDALRASQSEVELYNRIEFGTVDTDIAIVALAVNDVVRLVAELLDNATRFSPPNTVVVADGRRIRDYVVIQVEDRGLGMSEEQMDQVNRRLAEPADVDVAAFRLMGLAVVARLAARYGIRVEVRANIEGGTVAQVILPSNIVVLPNRRNEIPDRSGNRMPELGGAPLGAWDAMASRAATATLPALTPDPWRDPISQREPAQREPAQREAAQREPALRESAQPGSAQPGSAQPGSAQPEPAQHGGHPQLPMFPSQRPPATIPDPEVRPTPNRPPLPSRAARPVSAPANGFAADAVSPAPFQAGPASASPASFTAFQAPAQAGPPPVSAPPMSGAPMSGAPMSGAPMSGAPMSGAPKSGAPMSARPMSAPPVPDNSGWGAALAAMPPVPASPPLAAPTEERSDSPIFVQMQQSWFRNHDGQGAEEWGMPTAGYAPPPNSGGKGAGPGTTDAPAPPAQSPAPQSSPAHASVAQSSAAQSSAAQSSAAQSSAAQSSAAQLAALQSSAARSDTAQFQTAQFETAQFETAQFGAARSEAARAGAAQSAAGSSAGAPPSAAPRSEPPPVPAAAAPAATGHTAGTTGHNGASVPRPRAAAEDRWRTTADDGWKRAMAAAEPVDAGTTRSGLPKRVPQAQLVPGGVQPGPRQENRRSPDEVRGLLSAYHRGVQRGRTDGNAEAAAFGVKENEQ